MLKLLKDDHFLVFLEVLVIFGQVFGQVKECLMLKLYNIIRVPHLIPCPTVLICFVIEFTREECSNL